MNTYTEAENNGASSPAADSSRQRGSASRQWAKVPAWVAGVDVDAAALRAYLVVAAKAGKSGVAWPGCRFVGDVIGLSASGASRALKRAVRAGLLEIVGKHFVEGGNGTWTYTYRVVTEVPLGSTSVTEVRPGSTSVEETEVPEAGTEVPLATTEVPPGSNVSGTNNQVPHISSDADSLSSGQSENQEEMAGIETEEIVSWAIRGQLARLSLELLDVLEAAAWELLPGGEPNGFANWRGSGGVTYGGILASLREMAPPSECRVLLEMIERHREEATP